LGTLEIVTVPAQTLNRLVSTDCCRIDPVNCGLLIAVYLELQVKLPFSLSKPTEWEDAMTIHTGGCLCGAISYELEQDAVVTAMHCHCLDCQKSTGSGKATIIAIPESSLTVEGTLKYYSVVGTDGATVNRGFCENCGSPVISAVVGVEGWEAIKLIKAGSLDDSSWVTVNANIWKSSARHWDAVREELPTFEHNYQN
jgi:hypothetical protein